MKRRRPFRATASFRERVEFWRPLVEEGLRLAPTPFYLCSIEPVRRALGQLSVFDQELARPVRHWLSCKTQPLPPLLAWWQRQGFGIEVVSEFELLAALDTGFAPDRILLNGPAKHRWLPRHPLPRLRVNFDSLHELEALGSLAARLDWSTGLRCHTREDANPDDPDQTTQFGLAPPEVARAVQMLAAHGLRPETVHFHLRTNVISPKVYGRALEELAGICASAGFTPRYLDCGGGFPAPHVVSRSGRFYDASFRLEDMAKVYQRGLRLFPGVEELWLENGRFVSARSGVLVVRVLDAKVRPAVRHLICDGGRTMNALISNWEAHQLFSVPARRGPQVFTSVCGPTCMAFDELARRDLPKSLRSGDHLAWLDAGAYHLPWETRFSHGRAPVLWHEDGPLTMVRGAESFAAWWNQP